MPATFDPARCPLCAGPNHCAIAAAADAAAADAAADDAAADEAAAGAVCWCGAAAFAPETLEAVPAGARGQVCICARCAAGANNQQFRP
ncbi:MAG: cysteine-rich CWC family protein [Bacteroidetes bacterium]|nr:cysteine-rich CWC family protein [Bacteroidota bacterium]